jgi:hypothetical protein
MAIEIKSADLKAFTLGLVVIPVHLINIFKPQGQ